MNGDGERDILIYGTFARIKGTFCRFHVMNNTFQQSFHFFVLLLYIKKTWKREAEITTTNVALNGIRNFLQALLTFLFPSLTLILLLYCGIHKTKSQQITSLRQSLKIERVSQERNSYATLKWWNENNFPLDSLVINAMLLFIKWKRKGKTWKAEKNGMKSSVVRIFLFVWWDF